MHEIKVMELNKRFFIPEDLSECNREQYLNMSKLICMFQTQEITFNQFRVLALYSLMGIAFEKNKLENIQEEKWENIYMTSQILDTFFDIDDNDQKHLKLNFTGQNPVKTVKYKMMTFIGPKDGFKDMTWKQFIEAIGELQSFSDDGKVEHLVNIFAMFYLRPNEKIDKIDLDKRTNFFRFLDIRYIYAFFLLFSSFWKFIKSESIIKVDGREIDLRIMFEESGDSEDLLPELTELGFRSTSFQLAESGVFGTYEELEKNNFWNVLLRMYDMTIRNKKREAEMEQQKNDSK